MKNNPASIERNANASAQQTRADSANAAVKIFHSKQPETENHKENTMNQMNQNAYRVTDCLTDMTGNDLDALIEKATAKRWHGKLTIWKWNGRQWKYVRTYTF